VLGATTGRHRWRNGRGRGTGAARRPAGGPIIPGDGQWQQPRREPPSRRGGAPSARSAGALAEGGAPPPPPPPPPIGTPCTQCLRHGDLIHHARKALTAATAAACVTPKPAAAAAAACCCGWADADVRGALARGQPTVGRGGGRAMARAHSPQRCASIAQHTQPRGAADPDWLRFTYVTSVGSPPTRGGRGRWSGMRSARVVWARWRSIGTRWSSSERRTSHCRVPPPPPSTTSRRRILDRGGRG
jgi:hypothetical protein